MFNVEHLRLHHHMFFPRGTLGGGRCSSATLRHGGRCGFGSSTALRHREYLAYKPLDTWPFDHGIQIIRHDLQSQRIQQGIAKSCFPHTPVPPIIFGTNNTDHERSPYIIRKRQARQNTKHARANAEGNTASRNPSLPVHPHHLCLFNSQGLNPALTQSVPRIRKSYSLPGMPTAEGGGTCLWVFMFRTG